MDFTQLTADLNNHQSLGTRPNLNDGLSATELKVLYDKAANDIKTFINTVLLAELASSTLGNCAADKIGIEEAIIGSGTTLKARAEWLYNQLASTSTGSIPDGSLTEAKLASSLAALQIHYGVDSGAANTYVVTLGPAPTAYIEGMALAVKISADSTGVSTINVNGLGAKPIKGSDGLDIGAGDLKAGSIYTLRYNGTNFIVQGKGGVTLTGTAVDSHVLLNDTYYNTDAKTKRTGTMVNNGAVVITPTAVDQAIPVGYHNGLGKVVATTGKKWATGNGTVASSQLVVTGLAFDPKVIITRRQNYVDNNASTAVVVHPSYALNSTFKTRVGANATPALYDPISAFNTGGFTINVLENGQVFNWLAFE